MADIMKNNFSFRGLGGSPGGWLCSSVSYAEQARLFLWLHLDDNAYIFIFSF